MNPILSYPYQKMLVIEMRILSIKVLMKIYKNIEYNQEHSCFPVFFFYNFIEKKSQLHFKSVLDPVSGS